MIVIHDVEQGDEAWHKLHDGLWTGSTATNLLQNRPLPEWNTFAGNKWTKRGKLLEHVAIREYTVASGGIDIMTLGFVTNTDYPNAGYSPDGIHGDTLIEVKCLNGEAHEALVRGEIPLKFQVQIYFGLVICELKNAKLLAFNPEYEQQLTIIDIPYDEKIIENIRQKLLKLPTSSIRSPDDMLRRGDEPSIMPALDQLSS